VSLRCLALLFVVCSSDRSDAQLNVLTLREAESLIEVVPDVVASRQREECPNISPGYTEGIELDFHVRTTCGTGSGMLIGAYTVNRLTGAVRTWGDNSQSVADNQGSVIAAQLVKGARERILSASEAQCMAFTAASALPGWSTGGGVVSVKRFSTPATPSAKTEAREGIMHFMARRASSSRPVESGRMLTVYLNEARVRDEETGVDVISASVGDLGAKLLELRAPIQLNDEEAASIALADPRVVTNLNEECRLDVGGAFYAQDALMGVSCKNRSIRESIVLVNLETGTVTDPDTGKSLDTADTQRIALQLLSDMRRRRTELKKSLETICRAQ
jgi:hypothetical protein